MNEKSEFGEVMITLHVSREWKELCKKHMWSYREVFGNGIKALLGSPQLLDRINELEAGNRKLQAKLTALYGLVPESKKRG